MDSEFVGVFGSYNRLIYEDLKEIDKTFSQIVMLISNADEKIYGCLNEVQQLLERNDQQLLERVRESGMEDTTALEKLANETASHFAEEKNEILRSLQVTDMVTQLLAHSRTRMNRISKMSDEIERVAQVRMGAFTEMVQEMKALLDDTQFKIDSQPIKAVEQISVDEGDIEFF